MHDDRDLCHGHAYIHTYVHTYLVDKVQDLGQDADAFSVVDNVVVEVTCFLQHRALVQVGEGVHWGEWNTKWPTVKHCMSTYVCINIRPVLSL